MKPVNKAGCKVLDTLTDGLNNVCDHRKIDNGGPGIMSVSVENIGETDIGPQFSIAHYYKQNGDLMKDPEMVFIRCNDGKYYPSEFYQDGVLQIAEVSLRFENGKLTGINKKAQSLQAIFAGGWMENIKYQQQI